MTVRVSVTISGTITVFSTVSHVPQELSQQVTVPQLEPQQLAPHGLQLEAQGAEQHELALLPKQLPACADAVIRTAAASDKTYRMSLQLLLEFTSIQKPRQPSEEHPRNPDQQSFSPALTPVWLTDPLRLPPA